MHINSTQLRWGVMLLLLAFHISLQAQENSSGTIRGRLLSSDNQPLTGCVVRIQSTLFQTVSDAEGYYTFGSLKPGRYVLLATKTGFNTVRQVAYVEENQINSTYFMLSPDVMEMEREVETGTFTNVSKFESSIGITTLSGKEMQALVPRSTGDLLNVIPGNFVDASAGEVGAQIFPRGLSTGQNNQLGFRYISLQEEGLPVMSSQLGFAVVDMFHRPDATIGRLEAIRGGTSSIITANAPGGVFNFISKTGGQQRQGSIKLTGGLNNNETGLIRLDTEVGGSLKNKEWSYHIGGFYRQDAGPRTVPFMANQGGQIKANFTKKLTNGQLKFYGKYLNDRVTFYKHIPVKSLKGEPFENFDVATSSSFLSLKTIVPNSEDIPYNTASVRNFDADNAIRLQNMALGMAINQQKNDWQINNSVKLSLINQHYRQFQGNFIIPTGLAMTVFNPVALFPFATVGPAPGFPAAPAPAFPTYRDAATGEILAKFNGATPDANVPNQLGNFVYGTASLDMQNRVLDIMDNFSATYIQEKHRLTLGVYGAYAATKSLWNVDFLLTRLEPNPRPLTVIFASPYSPTTVFRGTDERGIVGYNAGAYTNFEGNSAILAGYINDYWNVSYNLKIEAGLRYEFLNYNGFKKGWSVPNESDAAAGGAILGNGLKNNGGLDGNPLTTYDNRFRLDNGSKFNFNDQYGYLSASLGFSQRVSANAALYGRATLGNKAPDIDYYVQNFVNQPITKGTTEKIWQGELGYKYTEKRSSFTLSGFYSYLDNILFQLFIPSGTTTLFTPPTFNAARTIGAEIEWLYLPTEALSFDISATLQNARFTKFTYYNVNGTTSAQAPTANRQALPNPLLDDFTENFDGNKVNDIPAVNLNLKVAYQLGRIKPYFQYRYIGQRYGNKRNTITLPAYGVINAGLLAHIGEKLTFNANINNVLNSKGIVQFDGVGVPGASIEDLAFGGVKSQNPTALGPNLNGEVINAANPSLLAIAPTDLNVVQATGRPYMVRPILPRLLTLSLSYAF